MKQLTVVISRNGINSCRRDSEVTKLSPSPSADPGSGAPSVGARQKDTGRTQEMASTSRGKLKGLKSRIKIFFQTHRHYC